MKQTFTLTFLFLTLFSFSQVRLEGTVKEPTGITLDNANVMAINKETNAMDAYAITDGQGRFRLNLKPNATYKIKISFIGFQPLAEEVTMATENVQKVFVLKEGQELDGVEIVHTMPVTVKGDTIVYDGDSFKTGEERKLEDVLKKLPGVEVTADGQVQVEGKNVSKLLVEGKPFFEGDTKLGVKNIPSDAVDKIQVLRNFNEVGQMRGLENNNEDVAINIKLKKGKDRFWFGDVSLGGGSIERFKSKTVAGWLVNPKIFYYSPKTSINFIGNLNNIGEESFTARDFNRLTGGARNTISRSGTNLNFSRGALGLTNTENVANVVNRFGAANASHQFSKKFTISGFTAYTSTTTDTETNNQNSIYAPNSNVVATQEDRTTTSTLLNKSFVAKIGSKYKASDRFQLDYDAFMRRSGQEDNNQVSTVFRNFNNPNFNNNNSIISFNSNDPIEFNQSLNAFYTQNEKSTWVLEMQHQYQDEDPFYNPNLSNNPFLNRPGSVFVNENSLNINQNRFVETNRIDAKLDYYYQINNKSILNLTLGNTNATQNYLSSIFQTLENNQTFQIANADFNNRVDYRFNDAFLGVHYKFVLGKFTFNPGVTYHKYNTVNTQNGKDYVLNFDRLLPDVFAQWQIKKSETMTYNFRMSNVFNDINSLVEGYTFSNFNSITRGQALLENALQTSHNLTYFKYNLFNYTTIIGNLSYNSTKNPVNNRTFFDGIYQTSERRNLNVENELINGFASYSRNFKKYYKATARVNANWTKFNGLRTNPQSPTDESQDFVQTNENFTHTYTGSFGTQYKVWPNVDLGYTINFDEGSNNKFTRHSPFVRLNYFFLDGLNINLDYTYNEFVNNQTNQSDVFELFGASINYKKKDSPWEFRLQANNLLNTQTRNTSNFNVNGFSATQFVILPRIITFTLRYNL
jgi:hypothetical protein